MTSKKSFANKQQGEGWALPLVLILFSIHLATTVADAAGTVTGWGKNDSLQTQVPPELPGVGAIAAGDSHSLALTSEGTVVAWGGNADGQATVPEGLSGVTAVAASGNNSLALGADGTVLAWGKLLPPPANLSNVVAIAAGISHGLALRKDGTVVSWGNQTNAPVDATNVIAISAGGGHCLALRMDGRVVAWGDNTFRQAEVPAGLSNVIAIAAGGDHCLALKQDGTVVGWGRNDHGQVTIPAGLGKAVAISAGALHSLALRADGSLVSWGDDTHGQVSGTPAGTAFVGLAAGAYHNLAIRGDGQPVIVLQPCSQTVEYHLQATFRVLVVGASPFSYQWQWNGAALDGGTNSTFVLPAIPFYRGTYTVVVSNSMGSVTSSPAFLAVSGLLPRLISSFPDTNVICGDSVSLPMVVQAPYPSGAYLYYQWSFEGQPIASGPTNSTLFLYNVNPGQAGNYSCVVTNMYGSVSASASLTVSVEPPQLTSPGTLSATQGEAFTNLIQASHSPSRFEAVFLPNGLSIDPVSGIVSGSPLDSGAFDMVLNVFNGCTNGFITNRLNVASAAPVLVTTTTSLAGTEGVPLSFQLVASGPGFSYMAENLPAGLDLNPTTGLISGTPLLAGKFITPVWATNRWGTSAGTVYFTITNAPIAALAVGRVTYNYSSPYLLDFSFSLLDSEDPQAGNGVVAEPHLLSVACLEDGQPISASETGASITRASTKVTKAYLVLDFTQSIASLGNGDTNLDGISDAVDSMVNGAIQYVNEQSIDTQTGVYEFHREDMDPVQVTSLTTDKAAVNGATSGIWTNNVQGFPAGSRCWDALMAAVQGLGDANRDEEHFVVLVSDGRDESSATALEEVITAATNAQVRVFTIGFGAERNDDTLQNLATATEGRYFPAETPADITRQFAQVSKMTHAQYVLRWATLKRSTKPFMPSFQISYQGLTANSPTNPIIPAVTNIDETTDPPTTNVTPQMTNFIIGYFYPQSNAGPVLVGSLRLVPNAEVQPTGLDLRASYVPRYVRNIRLHYRANWPCVATIQSTQPGELLSGWSMDQSDDGEGGSWLLLSSPNTNQLASSLPFASFGKLITFAFQDPINPSNAFSFLEVDNSIYTNAGKQSFEFENLSAFVEPHPALPHRTPVPWLMEFGITGDPIEAEELDSDADGVPNWQEYLANTNPTNAASVFAVRNVSYEGGRYRITFNTSRYRTYQVQASTDLQNWRTVEGPVAGMDQDVTVTDNAWSRGLGDIYYRILAY